MRLFLTGASGFLGYHVAALFVKEGWKVTALARASSDTRAIRELGVSVHEGDLLAGDTYLRAMLGFDVVVHCAGAIRALGLDEFLRVNGAAAGEVARTAAGAGVRRFIHISSIAARGPAGRDERPVSWYGESKLSGEQQVCRNSGSMAVAVVRPPVIFGPRDFGLLSAFRMAHRGWFPLYGDGRRKLSIVYGEDAARAILLLAARKGELPPGPFYPADSSNPTWLELAGLFEQAMDRRLRKPRIPTPLFKAAAACGTVAGKLTRKAPLFSLDKEREMSQVSWECSAKTLTQATGWKPEAPLAKRIAETYRWYWKNGWL